MPLAEDVAATNNARDKHRKPKSPAKLEQSQELQAEAQEKTQVALQANIDAEADNESGIEIF
jgi:hypothetical protein